MKKLLITGVSGFLGSRVAQYYKEKYENIRRWGSGTSFPQIDRETENPTSDGAFVPVPDVTGI